MEQPGRRRVCRLQDLPWSSPGRTSPSWTRSRPIADRYGAQLRLTRLRPSGRGADVLGPAPSHRRPAAGALRLAHWPTASRSSPETPSSIWPPSARHCPGSTCVAPAGWSVSSIRWAMSTPVLLPSTTSSRRATCAPRAGWSACGGSRTSSWTSASRHRAGPAARVATTTRAGAGAWRPSSSPVCRWTGPIPSASRVGRDVAGPAGRHPPSQAVARRLPSQRQPQSLGQGVTSEQTAVTVAFTPADRPGLRREPVGDSSPAELSLSHARACRCR